MPRGGQFPEGFKPTQIMMFVDGENLAMRYKDALGGNRPPRHVAMEPDVYVWSQQYMNSDWRRRCDFVRKHFYTSVSGDQDRLDAVNDALAKLGIDAPRVFKRDKQRGSKRVDISLAVDMLSHAYSRNFEAAILITGDEDFVPLVDAVTSAGRRVFLWALTCGLSPALRRRCDHVFELDQVLLAETPDAFLNHVCE